METIAVLQPKNTVPQCFHRISCESDRVKCFFGLMIPAVKRGQMATTQSTKARPRSQFWSDF